MDKKILYNEREWLGKVSISSLSGNILGKKKVNKLKSISIHWFGLWTF